MVELSAARIGLAVTIGVVSITAGGCGYGGSKRPTAHLQGTITIGGQPLPDDAEATLTFKPTAPGQASTTSATVVNGRYDAPDVPVGQVKVYVNVQQPTGRMIRESGGSPFPEYRNLVPAEHGTGISLEVKDDNPQQDFEL